MSDRIEQIEQRLKAAMPRPWTKRDYANQFGFGTALDASDGRVVTSDYSITYKPNFALIADAPDDIAWLIARVRELEAKHDRDREVCAGRAHECGLAFRTCGISC